MPSTHRLGNCLDAWYFGSLGSEVRKGEFRHMRGLSDRASLGQFLTLDDALARQIDEGSRAELVKRSDDFWASYSYPHISMAMPYIRAAVRRAIGAYQRARCHRLPACKYDCIIHYRVGDFIELGYLTIPVESVAAAVGRVTDPDAFIGIADGGSGWGVSDRGPSKAAIERLVVALRKAGRTGPIQVFRGDADSDFFKCAQAPVLVTGPGSFAIWAAIANANGTILTPAMKNINFGAHGQRQAEQIAPNWRTYNWR